MLVSRKTPVKNSFLFASPNFSAGNARNSAKLLKNIQLCCVTIATRPFGRLSSMQRKINAAYRSRLPDG